MGAQLEHYEIYKLFVGQLMQLKMEGYRVSSVPEFIAFDFGIRNHSSSVDQMDK